MTRLVAASDCQRCAMRSHSIFAGLEPQELCELGMQVDDLEMDAGEILYHEGDPAQVAYTLRDGAIKLVKHLADGQSPILRILHRGDLFGFEGLQQSERRHSAVSLSAGKLCRLDLKQLDALSRRLPKIREAILRRWQDALQHSEDRIIQLGARRAEARLSTFLLQWAEAYPQQRHLPFPLTRQDLGAFLGLSTEHVSRIMADFKRQGWLAESRNSLEILNPQALVRAGNPSAGDNVDKNAQL